MKPLFITIILGLLVPYLLSLDVSICTENGQVCSSCDELAYCIESSEGFEINHLGYCGEGLTCLRRSCTAERNPLCNGEADLDFPCHDVGVFPDPFDCHKYHFCVPTSNGIENYPATCNNGWGYDPNTLQCTKNLTNNVCEDWPIPLCPFVGATDAFDYNKTYFYVCADYSENEQTLYPHLFVCPNGGSYEDYECH